MLFDAQKPNNLIAIQSNEVPDYWHVIQPGLKYMVDNNRNPDGWKPAQVFKLLYEGKASCVFTSIARKPKGNKRKTAEPVLYETREQAILDSCGFGIVQVLDSPNAKVFHIWIAVSNDTTNKQQAPSILTTFHDEVWELAKGCGCTHISFGTNQDWWDELAPRFGFSKQETKWITTIPTETK
ncbi:hypothetical protein [Caballeronia zhejiangensis]|uniref:hypothetical protein n=1 Tax=Caballeronia zhejiangensis TaxID=871203 RepID=UPI001F51F1FF|nr:hypothetical protein [Caballeronia zhejiangensis]MCI1046947.1 hypothetical protein [Caballeronia zhejiangensis]